MSRLEEALSKAGKLRGAEDDTKKMKLAIRQEYAIEKISSPYIITSNESGSPISEEYRRFKSILFRETKLDFLNTIMVTSSINNEGKSLTSVNLAIALAQEIDHSILLIDADFRNPSLHKYLGVDYKYGLSDYLMRDIDIADILIRMNIGNMVFLPAGRLVENPVELLSSDKMKAFMNEVKNRYVNRYVLVDTPPILSCAEGIAIGSYVDGIIFVVREGLTKKEFIEDALNMMQGLNILGTVLNGKNEMNTDGHYYQYYNKYKGKGQK